MAYKVVRAKKEYHCDLTNEVIKVGEKYKRVNIRNVGIFHFKLSCKNYSIEDYLNRDVLGYDDFLDAWGDAVNEMYGNGCY